MSEEQLQKILEDNSLTGDEPELKAFAQEHIGQGFEVVLPKLEVLAKSLKPVDAGTLADILTQKQEEEVDPVAEIKARKQAEFEAEVVQQRNLEAIGVEGLFDASQQYLVELKQELYGDDQPRRNMKQRMAIADRKAAEFRQQFGIDPMEAEHAYRPDPVAPAKPDHPVPGRAVIQINDPRQRTDE